MHACERAIIYYDMPLKTGIPVAELGVEVDDQLLISSGEKATL